MRFQANRAYDYYEAALPLTASLAPPGRAVFLVILRTYRALLDAIVERDFDIFTARVRLGRWYKLWLAARGLARALGAAAVLRNGPCCCERHHGAVARWLAATRSLRSGARGASRSAPKTPRRS